MYDTIAAGFEPGMVK